MLKTLEQKKLEQKKGADFSAPHKTNSTGGFYHFIHTQHNTKRKEVMYCCFINYIILYIFLFVKYLF